MNKCICIRDYQIQCEDGDIMEFHPGEMRYFEVSYSSADYYTNRQKFLNQGLSVEGAVPVLDTDPGIYTIAADVNHMVNLDDRTFHQFFQDQATYRNTQINSIL